MKFYLETVTEETNQNVQSVREFPTLTKAEIAYHEDMASAILNDHVLYARCTVRNEYGMQNMRDEWQAATGEPSPHFLVKALTTSEGETTEAIFRYASKDLAVSAWHSLLAQEMKDNATPRYDTILAIVEDKAGNTNDDFNKYWQRNAEADEVA